MILLSAYTKNSPRYRGGVTAPPAEDKAILKSISIFLFRSFACSNIIAGNPNNDVLLIHVRLNSCQV